jgi:hypothetical protein
MKKILSLFRAFTIIENTYIKKKWTLIILITFLVSVNYGQDCDKYNNYSKFVNCRQCYNSYYKIYLKPQNISIGITDTLKYNIVFNGNRDYIISFCADQIFYPISIKLYNSNFEKIYDNANSGYNESIKVGVKKTQNIKIEVSFLSENYTKERIRNERICVGMILQWRKLSIYRVNDI